MNSTCEAMEGFPRSGKSACAVLYIVDDVLPSTNFTVHTNLPLNLDAIVAYAYKRHGLTEQLVRRRLRLLPAAEVATWKNSPFAGPWSYFKGDRAEGDTESVQCTGQEPLSGCLLIIDEFQKFCPRTGVVDRRRYWREFMSTLGHECAKLLIITQNRENVDEIFVKSFVERSRVIDKKDAVPDPFFGIPFGDWFELDAKFLSGGVWSPVAIQRIEGKKVGKGAVQNTETTVYRLDTRVYKLYSSYSAERVGAVEGQGEDHQFQRRTAFGLLRWFLFKHWYRLFFFGRLPLAIWAIFLVFMFLGRFILGAAGVDAKEKTPEPVPALRVPSPVPGAALGALASAGGIYEAYSHPREFVFDIDGDQVRVPEDQLGVQLGFALERLSGIDSQAGDSRQVVALTAHRAYMGDGSTLAVGDPMEGNPDVYVLAIAVAAGTVFFSNGDEWRLRARPAVAPTGSGLAGSSVSGPSADDASAGPSPFARAVGHAVSE